MSANTYDLGDVVQVEAEFKNLSGTLIDPTTVKLSTRNPSGTVTTYTYGVGAVITKDAVGQYHADIDANLTGTWFYRWWSTGTGQAAEEKRFVIRAAQAS